MASKLSLGYLWATSLLARGGQEPNSLCKAIDLAISNRTTYLDTSKYTAAQSSYYSGQERELRPQCIFTPTDATEVSRLVQLITTSLGDGRNASWPTELAIRGGGHAVFAGAANVAGGITVDLRALNSVSLSDDRKTATIGAGAVWSDIYPQLVPYDITVMGGRVAGVGAGGFLLGGGSPATPTPNSSLHRGLSGSRWHISLVTNARMGV
jgi:FAD/FMN-containing dehydrogenase